LIDCERREHNGFCLLARYFQGDSARIFEYSTLFEHRKEEDVEAMGWDSICELYICPLALRIVGEYNGTLSKGNWLILGIV